MRTARDWAAILGLALTIIAWAPAAWARCDLGPKIACEIAFQELNEQARREVVRLLRGDPQFTTFADSYTWPDHPQQRASEHFIINASRRFTRFTDARCPMAPTCLFTAIRDDLDVLRTSTSDRAKLASLKFLGRWVGDHQPLLVPFQDDRGGNKIRVAGPCSASPHSVWDTCIRERGLETDLPDVAQRLRGTLTAAGRSSLTATPSVGWINESFLIARSPSVGCCVRDGRTCLYAPGHEQFHDGQAERPVTVDVAYIEMHARLVAARGGAAGPLAEHHTGALGYAALVTRLRLRTPQCDTVDVFLGGTMFPAPNPKLGSSE